MAEKKEKLFDQFPGVSYEEWRAKVEADLKGADFNKKLVWRTNEGFNVVYGRVWAILLLLRRSPSMSRTSLS